MYALDSMLNNNLIFSILFEHKHDIIYLGNWMLKKYLKFTSLELNEDY